MPRSAACHTIVAILVLVRTAIPGRGAVLIQPGIRAPFPEIAMQVMDAKGVRRERPTFRGDVAIRSARLVEESVFAIKVGDFCRDRFSKAEWGAGACPAGIFPLRFTGQLIIP